MTNVEIIAREAQALGLEYTGENFYTFHEWKKRKMSVKKGQKSIIKIGLWVKRKVKNEEGEEVEKMFLKTASLFHESQVEPLKEK